MWYLSLPKCGRRTLYGELRQHLGQVFRELAEPKESRIEEEHPMPDHVHRMIAIPPKYAVWQVIGFIKGKSAIHLARVYGGKKRNFVGQHFWARVLGICRRAGRDGDPRVHPATGGGGQAIGANQPVALTGHRTVAPNLRGRVSDPG